jgi:hypothetical protein
MGYGKIGKRYAWNNRFPRTDMMMTPTMNTNPVYDL